MNVKTPNNSEKKGFFSRLKQGLSKTREILTTDIDELFTGNRKLDDGLLEELEELLITSDIGVSTTMGIMDGISKNASEIKDAHDLKQGPQEKNRCHNRSNNTHPRNCVCQTPRCHGRGCQRRG